MQSQPQVTRAHSFESSDRGFGRPAPIDQIGPQHVVQRGNTPRRALFPPPFPLCGQMAETENLKVRFGVMVTTRALSKLAANGDADAQFRLGYRFAFRKDSAVGT